MPSNNVRCICPNCSQSLAVTSQDALGKRGRCSNCKSSFTITRLELAPSKPTEEKPLATPFQSLSPTQIQRKLAIIQLRQRVRGFCDKVGLGPTTGERFCCMLIVGVIPFVISFVIAILTREPAGYAALQGVGSFALTALFGMLLVGKQADEQLETRREQLVLELPTAREREAIRRLKASMPIETPIQEQPREQAPPGITNAAPPLVSGQQQVVVQVKQVVRIDRRKSSAVAALLELFFGFFLGTFGIGHFYAGSVGVGLFLLLGWWFYLFVNVVLAFFSCGLWSYLAIIVVPVPWFFLLILSPILAANEASAR